MFIKIIKRRRKKNDGKKLLNHAYFLIKKFFLWQILSQCFSNYNIFFSFLLIFPSSSFRSWNVTDWLLPPTEHPKLFCWLFSLFFFFLISTMCLPACVVLTWCLVFPLGGIFDERRFSSQSLFCVFNLIRFFQNLKEWWQIKGGYEIDKCEIWHLSLGKTVLGDVYSLDNNVVPLVSVVRILYATFHSFNRCIGAIER